MRISTSFTSSSSSSSSPPPSFSPSSFSPASTASLPSPPSTAPRTTTSTRAKTKKSPQSSGTLAATTLTVLLASLLVVSAVVFFSDRAGHAPPLYSWPSSTSSSLASAALGGAEFPSSDHAVLRPPATVAREGSRGGDAASASPGGAPAGRDGSLTLPHVAAPAAAPAPAPNALVPVLSSTEFGNLEQKTIDPSLGRIELGLAQARAAIRRSIQEANRTSVLADPEYVPKGPVYRNAYAFHRSYLEMEKVFRVYVYEEGEPPLFHDGPCKSIYSMEGRFIYNMEVDTRMRTRDPEKAHVHFLPFSVTKMVKYVYQPKTHDIQSIRRTIRDYIHIVSERYPYWNRSLGADHFMLSCHDWGPSASKALTNLYSNSIRVLCNANTSEGFNPTKDVSLPEINLKTGLTTGIIGGPSASGRPILAFFAGGVHGPIRPILLEHWKGKDNDVQVYEYLPKGVDYYDMMKRSKYCICPSGYEVASPRVVEAMYLECVPVIISDSYVLPFSDVLNWKSFSVQIAVKDIPRLKEILQSISPRQYIRMQRRVRIAQRHFVVSSPPRRFDVFYMILHSIWLRRMNIRIHPQ